MSCLEGERVSCAGVPRYLVPSQAFFLNFSSTLVGFMVSRRGDERGGVKGGARRASKTYSSQGAKKAPPPQNHPRLSPSTPRFLPLRDDVKRPGRVWREVARNGAKLRRSVGEGGGRRVDTAL